MIPPDYDRFEAASRRSTVYSTKGIVACSQPLAAEAGIAILGAGGNAADAAVAMAAALNVTEPCNCGIGGDAFALFWDAKQRRVRAVNGSGRSAKALSLARATEDLGLRGDRIPLESIHAATVPGAAAALVDMHRAFGSGRLSLSQVLAPAIALAEDGFPVHQMASYEWRLFEDRLRAVAAECANDDYPFLIDGRAPRPGQVFRNPALAGTLRRLAAEGRDGFYKGPVAEAIIEACTARGGLMTPADLAAHESDFVEPISYTYGPERLRIYECPPNGQGLAALIAFGILDVLREDGRVDLDTVPEGSAQWYHVLIEALRLAFADVHKYVADPNFVNVPVDLLLSKDYLRQRAALFNSREATAKYEQGRPFPSSDTVYLTAADSEGNAMSLIMSNYLGFGTAIVPRGCGFSLQSRGSAFSLDPKSPNVLEGGKRPFHTIIPAMVTKDDELFMSYGVMGAVMQPQGHVQVLVNLLHGRRHPQLALDAKRFCIGGNWIAAMARASAASAASAKARDNREYEGRDKRQQKEYYNSRIAIEAGVPEETIAQLEAMGHEMERVAGHHQLAFGKGQVILRTVDPASGRRVWAAGSDFRADGCALAQI